MNCLDPWRFGVDEFRCSTCDACRAYRRRVLTSRICLEAGLYSSNSFVTLTYREDPKSVCKREAQRFLKRLLYHLGAPFRYVLSAEYGDLRGRPHYHAILFGVDAWEQAGALEKSWSAGFIQVAPFTLARAMYVAGYVLKKMCSKEEYISQGISAPFVLRSLKPGIGARCATDVLASFYKTRVGQEELAIKGDVEACTRMDGQFWPLGSYMRKKMRDSIGFELNPHFNESSRLKRDVGAAAGVAVMDEFRAEQEARREVDRLKLKTLRRNINASL